jgi:SAM-dependent methyltransferase
MSVSPAQFKPRLVGCIVVTLLALSSGRPALANGPKQWRLVHYDKGFGLKSKWYQRKRHALAAAKNLQRAGIRTKLYGTLAGQQEKTAGLHRAAGAAKQVEQKPYNDIRDYSDYAARFGDRFDKDVKSWTADMRIADFGAGEARFFEYVAITKQANAPAMYAISIARPQTARLERFLSSWPKLHYIEGTIGTKRYTTERKLGFGTFDRVVDVLGAVAYAPRLERVIKGAGRLLKPGGLFYFAIDTTRRMVQINDKHGKPVEMADYLKSFKGFELVEINKGGAVLRRTADPLREPKMRLVDYLDGTPPFRAYQAR